ncbi:hypothetical protein ABZ896_52235, partial [Streptomyces sp. NPDC047072]
MTGAADSAPPDLSEATRHATLLDLLGTMTTTLLTTPREAVLAAAAGVLHGGFADWVVADAGAAHLSRTAVLGPSEKEAAALAERDPAAGPPGGEAGPRRRPRPSRAPRGPPGPRP